MNQLRITELAALEGVVERDVQTLLLDDGVSANAKKALMKKLFGTGAGAANMLAYKEEITEITAGMYASIADGSFDKVHVGMHYTAPSGRNYYFAHADYYYGHGPSAENLAHHMVVIEDELTIFAAHASSNDTTGGAAASLIYTTTLPDHQSELETDFGASHIKEFSFYQTNAVSDGVPSGEAAVTKKAALMNLSQVMGHPLGMLAGGDQHNCYNRERQFKLFEAMPETIIARKASDHTRYHWWCDDVESASRFGYVNYFGAANGNGASGSYGVRRAFLIG